MFDTLNHTCPSVDLSPDQWEILQLHRIEEFAISVNNWLFNEGVGSNMPFFFTWTFKIWLEITFPWIVYPLNAFILGTVIVGVGGRTLVLYEQFREIWDIIYDSPL